MSKQKSLFNLDSSGGIGVLFLVIILVVSFAGLIYGILNLHMELEEKEKEMALAVSTEMKVESDPEQEKMIISLKDSLNSSMKRNADLTDDNNKLLNQIKKMTKDADAQTTQISFLSSNIRRVETSLREQKSAYEGKLKELKAQISNLEGIIDQGKMQYIQLEESKTEEVDKLKEEIAQAHYDKTVLEGYMRELQESNLVKETAKMHFNLANHFLKSKDIKMAVKEYERAIKLYPYDADAHYNLALIYDIYTDDNNAALQHYRMSVELDPNSKKIDQINERIVKLTLSEAAKIDPTQAKITDKHKLMLDNIQITNNTPEQ